MSRIENPYTRGVSGFEISSSGHLFDPEQLFGIVNQLNINTPEDKQLKIELYATHRLPGMAYIEDIRKRAGIGLPIPPQVDASYVKGMQEQYPLANVSRIHAPFTYNTQETLQKPFAEKGMAKARSVLYAVIFGSAKNMHAVDVAHDLSTPEHPVDLNAHVNIIEGFARDNRLDELRNPHALLLVENETEKSVNNGISTLDPRYVVEQVILPHNLDGLVHGYDHDASKFAEQMTDPLIQKHLKSIHFADKGHKMMNIDDPRIEQFMKILANIPFAKPVTVTFDLNPLEVGKLTPRAQFDYIKRVTEKMRRIQEEEQVR